MNWPNQDPVIDAREAFKVLYRPQPPRHFTKRSTALTSQSDPANGHYLRLQRGQPQFTLPAVQRCPPRLTLPTCLVPVSVPVAVASLCHGCVNPLFLEASNAGDAVASTYCHQCSGNCRLLMNSSGTPLGTPIASVSSFSRGEQEDLGSKEISCGRHGGTVGAADGWGMEQKCTAESQAERGAEPTSFELTWSLYFIFLALSLQHLRTMVEAHTTEHLEDKHKFFSHILKGMLQDAKQTKAIKACRRASFWALIFVNLDQGQIIKMLAANYVRLMKNDDSSLCFIIQPEQRTWYCSGGHNCMQSFVLMTAVRIPPVHHKSPDHLSNLHEPPAALLRPVILFDSSAPNSMATSRPPPATRHSIAPSSTRSQAWIWLSLFGHRSPSALPFPPVSTCAAYPNKPL
ncbi:hypothetical protein EXN66_Car022133 [Channa argus]|uniref:Uncharacterized protein n=1 Tax=Channa argus TaxID=215402 RepID=A0A6G1QUR4_CHAAH|nr:hypothetical protein EXN66_Car022133 [Channa argus]